MTKWERWEGYEVGKVDSSEMARWEVPGFIQEWGMQGESWISSFSFRFHILGALSPPSPNHSPDLGCVGAQRIMFLGRFLV